MKSAVHECDQTVVIIGAGPVGMNLALFLDRLGVRSVLFDLETSSRWHPKGSTHNSRTMEHYRWLGIAHTIRRTGLPADFPKDIVYVTSCAGWELVRFQLPSENEHRKAENLTPDLHQVPEPLLRSNQMYVERCLRQHVSTRPNIKTMFGWEIVALVQDQHGVTVTAESLVGGQAQKWRAPYVVACDGANSFTRRSLQISYGGQGEAQNVFLNGAMVSSFIRMPTFAEDVVQGRQAWMYHVISPRSRLILISLNGIDEYLIMSKGERPRHVPADHEVIAAVQQAVGREIPVSVIQSLPWAGGIALIADSFARDRILLCGDSCHLFSPTGGYGMNTGIDDARNLSWKLAACIQGWAPPALLATYEAERKPVASRNTRAALWLSRRIGQIAIPTELEDASQAGQLSRRSFGEALSILRSQFTSLGVELGVRYDGSPIICEGGSWPLDEWETYQPSSVPGGRLPHLWLSARSERDSHARRTSIYDVLGSGFTLVCVGQEAAEVDAFSRAARELSVPFTAVSVPRLPAMDLYQARLLLVRPDHHIAWRGDRLDRAPQAIFKRCLGWDLEQFGHMLGGATHG